MQPLSGNQRPDLLTSLMNMSLVLRLPREIHLCRSSSPHACHRFWKCYKKPWRFAHFWQGAESRAPATQNHIWTFKSGPGMWCFWHFDLETCFVPQWRALFRHPNFLKWSENDVFCTPMWLRTVIRATMACNGVQFFIFHPPRWLCTRGFSEPTWSYLSTLQRHKLLEKHSESPLFYLFAHLHLPSSDSFSSLIFFLLLFSLLTLPTCAFPSVHVVGSLTSKLPSAIKQQSNTTFYSSNML